MRSRPCNLLLLLLVGLPGVVQTQAPVLTPQGDPSVDDSLIYAGAVSLADYPGADYVLLFDDGIVRVETDGRRRVTYRQVVQILTQDGAEQWGELAYGYPSTRTGFTLNWLRVYSPQGELVSDGPAHAQESTPDVPLAAPVYTDWRVTRITVGGLEPGAILDVSSTYDTFRPAYAPDFDYSWLFNQPVDVRKSRFVVDVPAAIAPRVQERNVMYRHREYTTDDRRVLEWLADSIPAVELEPFPGTPNNVASSVRVSSQLPWDSIAGWYHAMARDRYELTNDIGEELAGEYAGARTMRDSVAAVHRWIAQDLRYVSLSLGDGGYQPRRPADVVETRFGDCKDKTTLFVAIVTALGLDASPVLVSTTGGVDSLMPTMLRFDHMIAAVETSRGREFADLTSPLTPFGRLPNHLQGEIGLLVRSDGSSEIVVLPADGPDASLREAYVAGELSDDGSFEGEFTVQATGVEEYELREAIAGSVTQDDADLMSLGEEFATGIFDRAVVDSVQALGGSDLTLLPMIAVWIKVPDLVTRSGSKLVLPLPLPLYSMDGWIRDLEADTLRRFPIDLEAFLGSARHRTEFVVIVPPGWRAELPPDVEVDGVFGRYRAGYAQEGRVVRAVREFAAHPGLQPPDSIAGLIAWMRAVSQDRTQFLVLEELLGGAAADSLAAVTSVPLAFGWPVGMEARVWHRFTRERDAGTRSGSSRLETSYRMLVRDHELGRLIEFDDFAVVDESGEQSAGVERLVEVATRRMPRFVVDEAGTLLELEDLSGFVDVVYEGVRAMVDSMSAEVPGLRNLMERTLTEEFYYARALELWGPLVFFWSGAEMEFGVAYESTADEPSPLYPEVLIPFVYTHLLESRVPCADGRADSACVRLTMQSRPDPEAVSRLLTQLFADLLEQGKHNVPAVEGFDMQSTVALITEPHTLIPHQLVVEKLASFTQRDSTGTVTTFEQREVHEYRFDYRGLAADAAPAIPLLAAAASGDLAVATELLQEGVDLEQRDPLGRTPLMLAAANGHEAVVRLLIFGGAQVEATDRTGATALVWASLGGHDAVSARLVQAGARIDAAYDVVRARGLVQAVPGLLRTGLSETFAPSDNALDTARVVYNQGDLTAALPLFVDAAARDTADADAVAWVAEVQRRLGNPAEAVRTGHVALARAPCHGHALEVIGVAHDPQYGDWPGANADTAWHYLRRAAECAPDDGNVWLALVLAAARVGEYELEREALRRLVSTGFLTPPTLATARWLLETAPDAAILLTGGDLDTYPMLALQEVEGIRRDVAVVNKNLLNLAWYRSLVVERHRLPHPDALRDELGAWRDELPAESLLTEADTAIATWRAAVLNGMLKRPFAIAMTAGLGDHEAGPGALERHGPFALVVDSIRRVDPDAVYAHFADLDPQDFVGPSVASNDRSAVRQESAFGGQSLIALTAIWMIGTLAGDDWLSMDTTTARGVAKLLEWTEWFAREGESEYADDIREGASQGYVEIGRVFSIHTDIGSAMFFARLAAALDPEYSNALNDLGYYSLVQGDADTAFVYLERAYAAGASLATLLNLVDASRHQGDLVAAQRWDAEANRLAIGDRLEDDAFIGTKWTFSYRRVGGSGWDVAQVESTDEKLALMHYWAAITEAAAGDWELGMARLATAKRLSERSDLQCVVHNRIEAMIERFPSRSAMVSSLRALAGQLTSRSTSCGVAGLGSGDRDTPAPGVPSRGMTHGKLESRIREGDASGAAA